MRGPDQELLDELYIPMLSAAVRYDRCCAYFSSSVLSTAARGFGKLIESLVSLGEAAPRPAVRLLVNEELDPDDVQALLETGHNAALEKLLLTRFKPVEQLQQEKQRLAMLGWLVKQGLLEVRVGFMRKGSGILHGKFGIATDTAGDALIFNGSDNETGQALHGNYERLDLFKSWEDPEAHAEYTREFEDLWAGRHPTVGVVSLPDAVRFKLIKYAPHDPPTREPSGALARQKAAMVFNFIAEAPYLPNGGAACDSSALVSLWPHQRRVVEEAAQAWPAGRLLCDEVGMGKTIEAILILRRLLAGRGVKRCLFLLPAGLLKQWQTELREKGGLIIPRLEGLTLIWPDDTTERVENLAEALHQDLLLMSRETARTENNLPILLNAPAWDLVLLDEAHAARRRKPEENEFNSGNLLLDLLRQLQLRQRARGLLLLSATPMQLHPWEPWDLLSVLGEGGRWLSAFSEVRGFYRALEAVRRGQCDQPTARRVAALIADSDPVAFPPLPDVTTPEGLAQKLVFAPPGQRADLAQWLRAGSPLTRRMHRNTRDTLRQYYAQNLLTAPPPTRDVQDRQFDYLDAAERAIYQDVRDYIDKRFDELERAQPGKGFVMTIYSRRVSSSPAAIHESLKRRHDALKRVADSRALDETLTLNDVPDGLDSEDLPETDEGRTGRISAALPTSPQAARKELADVEDLLHKLAALNGKDTKRDLFFDHLRHLTEQGRPVLVFTGYTDTMNYLREALQDYGRGLGCYSGQGGFRWTGADWKSVTKDEITRDLREGKLQVLLCTDAASEGLNLQAAGAVINYDLPWNPSKVEQRIGRIDRIGQKFSEVKVINLFLEHSVDDQVYNALRARCGLFEHFVGEMQPVLEYARRVLSRREQFNQAAFDQIIHEVQTEPLAQETYLTSEAHVLPAPTAPLTVTDMEAAFQYLAGTEYRVTQDKAKTHYRLSGKGLSAKLGATSEALEGDHALQPLSPLNPVFHDLATKLIHTAERLPLVVESSQIGAFRASVACWVTSTGAEPVTSFSELTHRLETWVGTYPSPADYYTASTTARQAADQQVAEMVESAAQSEKANLAAQRAAAQLRLTRELGYYLACLNEGLDDLNGLLYEHSLRDNPTAHRLRRCLDKLGEYPNWDPDFLRELQTFAQTITPAKRQGRLIGKELDAALGDPRWGG